jgi:hypothetical protein
LKHGTPTTCRRLLATQTPAAAGNILLLLQVIYIPLKQHKICHSAAKI